MIALHRVCTETQGRSGLGREGQKAAVDAFISNLMESGVEFVACDDPTANRMPVHILAAVVENEAQIILQRTKAALAAAKARGKKLARTTLHATGPKGSLAGVAAIKAAKAEAYQRNEATPGFVEG